MIKKFWLLFIVTFLLLLSLFGYQNCGDDSRIKQFATTQNAFIGSCFSESVIQCVELYSSKKETQQGEIKALDGCEEESSISSTKCEKLGSFKLGCEEKKNTHRVIKWYMPKDSESKSLLEFKEECENKGFEVIYSDENILPKRYMSASSRENTVGSDQTDTPTKETTEKSVSDAKVDSKKNPPSSNEDNNQETNEQEKISEGNSPSENENPEEQENSTDNQTPSESEPANEENTPPPEEQSAPSPEPENQESPSQPQTCEAGFHMEGGNCVANSRTCSIANGQGSQNWNGNGWDGCQVTSCNGGFHVENNSCVSNVRSCSISNGTGEQNWNGSGWNGCQVVSCNDGFEQQDNSCSPTGTPCSASFNNSGNAESGFWVTYGNSRAECFTKVTGSSTIRSWCDKYREENPGSTGRLYVKWNDGNAGSCSL